MKKIGIINQHNLSKGEIKNLPIREKVRGLIYKNKDTVICIQEDGYGVKKLLKLPGGSIEKGESKIKAIKREIREETGYDILDIKCIGFIENIRSNHVLNMTYYTAKTVGRQKKLELTKGELEVGTKPINMNLKKAIKRIQKEHDKSHNDSSLRDIMVFKELGL